jgi:nickel/cobalt exporter
MLTVLSRQSTVMLAGVCLLLIFVAVSGWFFSGQVMALQQSLHIALADALKAVEQNPESAISLLLSLSFLYGVFHAAGPGHGKAVIATYLASQESQIPKGIVMSVIAAFLQGTVAVVLVTFFLWVLDLSMRQVKVLANDVEIVSYVLVLVMGLLIVWRETGKLLHTRRRDRKTAPSRQPGRQLQFSNLTLVDKPAIQAVKWHAGHPARAGAAPPLAASCSCSHVYVPPESVSGQIALVRAGIILSMGLRPCTGAVLVLLLARVMDLYVYGIVSAYMMAAGTAITVSAIAVLSVVLRKTLVRLLETRTADTSHEAKDLHVPGLHVLGLAGGLVLCLLGSSFLVGALQSAGTHPLM